MRKKDIIFSDIVFDHVEIFRFPQRKFWKSFLKEEILKRKKIDKMQKKIYIYKNY